MPITAKAPAGGIVEQLGGESRPLILRQGEIERFEEQHNLGIFEFLEQVHSGHPQSRHCRDALALALVGGGVADRTADKIVAELPVYENMRVRAMVLDLLVRAFLPPEDGKKKADDKAGSSVKTARKATKQKPKSKAPSAQN